MVLEFSHLESRQDEGLIVVYEVYRYLYLKVIGMIMHRVYTSPVQDPDDPNS